MSRALGLLLRVRMARDVFVKCSKLKRFQATLRLVSPHENASIKDPESRFDSIETKTALERRRDDCLEILAGNDKGTVDPAIHSFGQAKEIGLEGILLCRVGCREHPMGRTIVFFENGQPMIRRLVSEVED